MNDPSQADDAALYRRYRPGVFDLLVRRLQNVEEAEALAQEAMLRALQAARTQEIRSFGAFVMRVAHNLATDVLRRRRFEGGWVDPEEALSVDADPERVELLRVRSAVMSLPEAYRRVVQLRYDQGLSFAEIGAALNMSKNGVFARHERALEMLRARFDRRRTP